MAIGGLANEFFVRNARFYNASAKEPLYPLEPHVAEEIFTQMLAEAGVVHMRAQPLAAVEWVAGGGAPAIAALVTLDGQRFPGDVFIDASYEGDIVTNGGNGTRHIRGKFNFKINFFFKKTPTQLTV